MSISKKVDELLTLIDQQADGTGKRYSFFPIQDLLSYSFFNRQEAAIWSSKKLDFPKDKPQFTSLPEDQKILLKKIIIFFAVADGAVSENLSMRFQLEATTYEERCMFIVQNFIELVHAETYGLFLEMFIPDKNEQILLLKKLDTCEPLKRKMDWMRKFTSIDLSKGKRFLAFSCAEGIFFPALFCIIFWFRAKGKLMTLAFANKEIAKDETLHRDYGAELFKKYRVESDTDLECLDMVKSAVEIECSFADYLLPTDVEDLNANDVKKFVKVVADNLLVKCGLRAQYHEKNPFTWANDISMEQKTNFYEGHVGNYKGYSLKNVDDWKSRITEKLLVYESPEQVEF